MIDLSSLSDEDKMVLTQQIVAGYQENRINDRVLAVVEGLTGHVLEGEVKDNYETLLSVYHKLGGSVGIINNTTINIAVDDFDEFEQLQDTWSIAKYILKKYHREVRVRRLKFDTYKLF